MELTEKEKQMLTEGIVFSTSAPIPVLIKEGIEGGNYVCNAFLTENELYLMIYDISLGSKTKQISIDGREIELVVIDTYINHQDSKIKRESSYSNVSLEIHNGDYIECDSNNWSGGKSLKSDRYEGLSLDTQAKLFFIDVLKVYLNQFSDNDTPSCDDKTDSEISKPIQEVKTK